MGDTLAAAEVDAILDFYVELIDAAVEGDDRRADHAIGSRHVQAPFDAAAARRDQLGRHALGRRGPVGLRSCVAANGGRHVTQFGDLGGELAARIAGSAAIRRHARARSCPQGLGRATVFGLLRHSTELSGTTIYLPQPERLPLKNVPIVGRIGPATTTPSSLASCSTWRPRSVPAACLQVDGLRAEPRPTSRPWATGWQTRWPRGALPPERTLVLLVAAIWGKSWATMLRAGVRWRWT